MANDSGDPACLTALEAAVGHAAPFSEAELGEIEALTVTHARDLAPIGGCVRLQHLRIIASELDDLLVCDQLAELTHLEVQCTRLGSLAGAAFCAKLERVDLLFTSLQDAGDLLGIESWQRGSVIGNPWNATSWGALGHAVERDGMRVAVSSEEEWQHTARLWERAQACCGSLPGGISLLVRPGLPTLTKHPYDALQVSTSTVDRELDSASFKLDKMFEDYKSQIQAPDLSELANARTLGSSRDAQAWIAGSALSAEDQAALARFVGRFPDVGFFRTSEAAIDRTADAQGARLPARYRAIRQVLDGWLPQRRWTSVRFDRFAGQTPRADRVGALHYLLGLRAHGDDTKAAMQAAGIINIGLSREQPLSVLAIRAGDADPQVYEYSDDDIGDAISEHRDVASVLSPVFPSYAAMLDHIVAIQPEDDAPILASNG